MPIWKRKPPEDQQQRNQAQQDAEASQRSIAAGGLPIQAQRRLSEEMQAGHPLFSSDLSVNEFSLARNQGYRALSQVMGSSIYQVGWQFNRSYYSWDTRSLELTTLSNAHQHAALLALGRLEQEAVLLNAHGIIGVRLTTRDYDWGQNLLEYTAIDGIVTGYCSYYVSLGSRATQQMRGWFGTGSANQEIIPFSQALYTARGLAMDRLLNMSRRLNALGVVGMHINCARQIEEREANGAHYMDLTVQFAAIGTAITAVKKDHVIPTPQPTLSFTDLRPGTRGETRELTIKG